MTNKIANSVDWTIEGQISKDDPRTLCETLIACGFDAKMTDSGQRATWVSSNGTPMEAVQFEECLTRMHETETFHATMATAIKPAGSSWEGFYVRVVLADFEYRYPMGHDPLISRIQILFANSVAWSDPRRLPFAVPTKDRIALAAIPQGRINGVCTLCPFANCDGCV